MTRRARLCPAETDDTTAYLLDGERVAVSALIQSRWQIDGPEQGARALGCFYGTMLPMYQYPVWARAEQRSGVGV